MTVVTDPTPVVYSDTAAARVSLVAGGRSSGPVDGAWWPYSRDLTLELPALAAAFEARWGRVTRAAVHPALWRDVPKKVRVAERVMHVGWFTIRQDPHTLLLRAHRTQRWDLLVIPPQTPPGTAARLMAAACAPGNVLTAGGLMARAAAWADRAQERDWETEGGWSPTVHTLSSRERATATQAAEGR